ncbi:MAG: TetR/AcrR family transcriptional regulator [Bacteroidales bacterium]|jgi:AcrR family transcriptional regulator|nr:TetR/AcrR family transcriptional regulator [Bacteroidales bacterium]
MKKLEKAAWLEEGLKVLANDGFQKVTIDNLCFLLQITKGSFYHHFRNIDGYIEALMKYWLEKNTVNLIRATDMMVKIDEKFIRLNDLASSVSQKAEQVIRAWSFSNEIVRRYMQDVDNMRLDYLISLNKQIGMGAKEAENYATLEYGTMIGVQQLKPNISQEDFKNLYFVFRDNKLQKLRDRNNQK